MSDDMEKIVERVQKILALGRRGGTEAEAAAAMAKAQELLARHNLEMAAVDGAQPTTREKITRDTGMYLYQRRLWKNVCDLNFCLCLFTQVREKYKGRRGSDYTTRNKLMIVGRKVNTRTTIAMGTYLLQTVDRLCRERLTTMTYYGATSGNKHPQFSSRWAVSFRDGAVDRVVEKIQDRRSQMLRAEEKKARDIKKKMAGAASTSTAISLNVYKDKETDANLDFLHGEGYSARKAAQRAEWAAEAEREEREYVEWATAHPEEARAEEEKRKKQRVSWGRSPREREVDWGGYRAGQEAGNGVGIDPQADTSERRRIGRGQGDI